jgi:dipeptidyl aminopeptidase/acylaminoacyl peptidase
MRYATMTQVRNQRVRILDLATGQARDLLPGSVQSRAPAWSPDGRRLALLTGNRSHYDITVVNADGSSPRRYPVPMHPAAGRENRWRPDSVAWEKPWSPDGRFLAFQAKDRDKVGNSPDDQYQLALLDLSSGQTRVLATSSATIGDFVWRPDGKAIRTLKRTVVLRGSPSRWSIVEIPVNGAEQLLRDISAEFPKVNDLVFASDRRVVVQVVTDKSPEFYLVPLDGGTARRLMDTGPDPGLPTGGFLLAGDRMLFVSTRGLKLLSFVGDPTRTLHPGLNGHHGVPHPDGKQIINVGKALGDSDSRWKIYLFSLDGGPTRLVGEIPRGTGGLLAPSPDGKLLAYTSEGRYTSKIHEIDFRPALQAIMKR